MSTPIRETIENYSNKYNKTIVNNYSKTNLDRRAADELITEALDLIDNKNFKPYFYKTLYLIGADRFRAAMSDARSHASARCRPCLFAGRLKELRTELGH